MSVCQKGDHLRYPTDRDRPVQPDGKAARAERGP